MSKKSKTSCEELDTKECQQITEKIRETLDDIDQWRKEGRCPYCGELGKFVGLGPVCSEHGPYSLEPPGDGGQREFDGGDPPEEG